MKCPKCQADNLSDSKYCRECASPLAPTEEQQFSFTKTFQTSTEMIGPGSIFARKYQIVEELGAGGMGKVYRVLDREIDEYVALKLIRPEIAADKNNIQRFRHELKFARKISHKNVCRMFDLNKQGETYYITMEYVSGEDLKASLRRIGPLSIGKAITVAKQISEGLKEAHRMGVIHRDLKPQNIMIDREGNVRIMDFGIARSLEVKGITASGGIVGTPDYMSPEQVEAEGVDARSDIYSLGVILYEMVTGRMPFEGHTPMSVALKRMIGAPAEPRGLNEQIPEEFSRVIMKCLEKEKEKRYQNVEELIKGLDKAKKSLPSTQNIVPESSSRATKGITVTLRPKKILLPMAWICMASVLGFLGWKYMIIPRFSERPKELSPLDGGKAAHDRQELEPEAKLEEATEKTSEGLPVEAQPKPPEKAFDKDDPSLQKSPPRLEKEEKKQEAVSRLAEEINDRLRLVRTAFQSGNYEECLDQIQKVLALDGDNAEAKSYSQQAEQKIASQQIHLIVKKFVQSWNEGILTEFYRESCSSQLYERVKNDAEMVMKVYQNFRAVALDVGIQFKKIDQAEVSFSTISTGIRKSDGRRQVIFEGIYHWEMIKRERNWQIVNINTRTK